MKRIINGIVFKNPIFVSTLGLCSALAVTNNFENAYIMGFCVCFVLMFSTLIISLIKNVVPDNVRIPVYILIIATFVTMVEILLNKFLKPMYDILGIYIPLIVVNCIVLGRQLQNRNKKIFESLLDSFGVGVGYLVSLMVIGAIREILGYNTITFMNHVSSITGYRAIYRVFPTNDIIPMNIFSNQVGAFLTLGFLIALFKKIGGKHGTN
ncbi:MAG: electron transport complex subunit RsxE [Bacilli bacterium]|nr:electron transport complex subunit RsxE [Bacilli bacterium]